MVGTLSVLVDLSSGQTGEVGLPQGFSYLHSVQELLSLVLTTTAQQKGDLRHIIYCRV